MRKDIVKKRNDEVLECVTAVKNKVRTFKDINKDTLKYKRSVLIKTMRKNNVLA